MPYKPISPQEISLKATKLFEKYNIDKVAVFGSCSRNEMQRGSDIDLLIEIENLSNPFVFVELKRKSENLFKRKFDLISYYSFKTSDFKSTILSEAKVIYEKKH